MILDADEIVVDFAPYSGTGKNSLAFRNGGED
jgi:hypothetical protein